MDGGSRAVVATGENGVAQIVRDATRVYDLAMEAIARETTLAATVAAHGLGETVDLAAALAEGRVLSPIDHPDPAHLWLTGTGLTHLGSADARDAMHKAAATATTDSMRMFRDGLVGGKPGPGEIGAQPEWFYKGDGTALTAPGASLPLPPYAEDGGEEPEIAGIYLVGPDGTPHRLGFALANEFSDHITERKNYLLLAHSKLRAAAIGPELRVGALPGSVVGTSSIRRDGAVAWEKPFVSGEDNMSHSLANLEHHHFKYAMFRRPGDIHVHFLGTATLSYADGLRTRAGDVFEIAADGFGLALSNPLATAGGGLVTVRAL